MFYPYRNEPYSEPCVHCGIDVHSKPVLYPGTDTPAAHMPASHYWNDYGPICPSCVDAGNVTPYSEGRHE